MTLRRRLQAVVAIAAALAWNLAPAAARPVAAIDCSQVFCATIEIVPTSGSGAGRVTSDPEGIDCTWNGSRSGTCVYQFSWPHFIGGTTQVDLYLDPSQTSYACYALVCGEVDQTLVRTITLNAGDDRDIFPGFEAAHHVRLAISGSQSGSGRVTATPGSPALNCYWNGSALSGTCATDVYWTGSGTSVTFALAVDPDDGTYVCVEYGACSDLNQTRNSQTTIYEPGMTLRVQFYAAAPVTVSVTGQGTVVSNPAGINCPPTCSKWLPPDYPPDDWTEMHATPAAGWYLQDWGGACDSATSETCQFANGNTGASISAVFARLATAAPSATPRPTGTARPATAPPASAPAVETPGTVGSESAAPASSEGVVQPGSSQGATATQVAQGSTAGPVAGGGDPSGITPAPVPVAGSGPPGGLDVALLIVLSLAGLTVFLLVGYLLGRRGAARATRPRA